MTVSRNLATLWRNSHIEAKEPVDLSTREPKGIGTQSPETLAKLYPKKNELE